MIDLFILFHCSVNCFSKTDVFMIFWVSWLTALNFDFVTTLSSAEARCKIFEDWVVSFCWGIHYFRGGKAVGGEQTVCISFSRKFSILLLWLFSCSFSSLSISAVRCWIYSCIAFFFSFFFFLNIGLMNNRLLCCTFGFTEISSDCNITSFLLWSLNCWLVLLESLFSAAA